jgi:HSP20 family protein
MAIARLDPFKELEEMEQRFANLFGRTPMRRPDGREETMTVVQWAPLVDVIESEQEYLIKAELPEVPRENVKVTVQNGTLTISGERTIEKEEKDKKYHRIERAYGHFARSFTLPEDADPTRIRAEFKNGVLNVHIAKAEHARPKRVEVDVA